MSYVPDRRPIKVIRFYNGAADSTRGYVSQIRSTADARIEIFGALERAYALGFRRFCLYVPAGRPPGQTLFRLHQWQSMPDGVRDVLAWGIPDWLAAHPDAVMFPYLGIDMSPDRDWHAPAADVILADHTDAALHAEFMAGILPWLALSPKPGQMGIGLDNSTKNESMAELVYYAELVRDMGGFVMGEAIKDEANLASPPPGPPYDYDPIIYDVPCWGKLGPADGSNGYIRNATATWRADWAFDPLTTEAIALCQNGHLTSVAEALDLVDNHGYVLASQADAQDAYVLGGHGIAPGAIPNPVPDPPASTTPATETSATITLVGGDVEIDGVAVDLADSGDFGADLNTILATLDSDVYHRITLRGEHVSATQIDLSAFGAGFTVDATALRLLWYGAAKSPMRVGPALVIGGCFRRANATKDQQLIPESTAGANAQIMAVTAAPRRLPE